MREYLLFTLLPALVLGSSKVCTDRNGNPLSSKPFAIPGNCNAFYQCAAGELTTQNCPEGTVFNPSLKVCDWPANVPQCEKSNKRNVVICEGDSQTLTCPKGLVIYVKSAYYGRDDSTTCPHDKIKDTDCAAKGSEEIVKDECNGKNTCTVTASNEVFGDPCRGTYKYVEMRYVCKRPPRWNDVVICEHKTATLTCPEDQIIRIKSAFYGRDDFKTCVHPLMKTRSCSADGSDDIIKNNCNGENSCEITASNKVFGDPCFLTYKYVEVVYGCRYKPEACVDKNGNPVSGDPFKKPGDCNNFYQCSNGELHTMPCAPGTAFNPKLGVCDWPYNVPGCS